MESESETAYPIRTERLTLRFVREGDAETITGYRNDPQVAALQDWDLPHPEAHVHALIAAHKDRTDIVPGRGHQIGIEHEGRLVGDLYVGLDEHGGIAEIGFTLIPEAQGQGIAAEAAGAAVDDLVDRLGVHRIVAQLSPDNLASARLLERLGMTFESLTRRSFWWRGAWDDNLYYSMSDDERRSWRDRPRTAPADVRLVDITDANHVAHSRLRVHRSQERFVASVTKSYVDALFPERHQGEPVVPVLQGIEADGEPVGFLMTAIWGSRPYLWRFLVDRRHQGRGIGRRALDQWTDRMRSEGHTEVEVSWVPGKGGPAAFYRAAGFVPTGVVEEGEEYALLTL